MPESFKCPSCAAPLEFEGKAMQKCRFCGSNVIAPSPLYAPANAANFGDFSALTGKALKIAEIQKLIQSGRKIEAIKLFRETFGVGLKEAKDSVEAMERGESVDISGMQIRTTNFHGNAQNLDAVKKVGFTIGGSILLTSLIIVLVTIGAIFAVFYFVSNQIQQTIEQTTVYENQSKPNSLPKSGEQKASIAQEILKIGGEGIGAGKFKDNRSIAVGADGKIYSADYTGGRIQIFNSEGVFQTQVTVEAERALLDLAVDGEGNLYVLLNSELIRFSGAANEFIGKTKIDNATDLAAGADGKIYVSTRKGEIFRLNSDGAKVKTIKVGADASLEEIRRLAIDGAGNFYAIDGKTHAIFKLSTEGKFISRFGGRSETSGETPKNQFVSAPQDLAVDSKNRVYVSQVSKVSIFDANGNYSDEFQTTQTFGLIFNDADELFTASRPFVVKYKLN